MNRLTQAIKTDAKVQFRNNLYHVGIIISVLIAAVVAGLVAPSQMVNVIPAMILLIIGGTTMLYVAGMVIFEKDEGTIAATIVSPLKPSEYLIAKIASLVGLATLESLISIYGAILVQQLMGSAIYPNFVWLMVGILAIGVMYTLVGMAMVVRFNRITDFLIPMAAFSIIMQIPFLYFWGVFEHPALLIAPTSAPTMLIAGAFRPLELWEQLYAIGYSAIWLIGLAWWARGAFQKHIIEKMG